MSKDIQEEIKQVKKALKIIKKLDVNLDTIMKSFVTRSCASDIPIMEENLKELEEIANGLNSMPVEQGMMKMTVIRDRAFLKIAKKRCK